jgi:hypothetical protein
MCDKLIGRMASPSVWLPLSTQFPLGVKYGKYGRVDPEDQRGELQQRMSYSQHGRRAGHSWASE